MRTSAPPTAEKTPMNRSVLALTLVLLTSVTVDARAQRKGPALGAPGAPLTVSARIDDKNYGATGPGSCRHAPTASIHGIPAALWLIEYDNRSSAGIKRLNLTLWRPTDGSSDQVSLSLSTSSTTHRINSVGKPQSEGAATVKISPLATGGRLELKGNDAGGATIELTVVCPAFVGVEAEGG